MCVCAVEAVSVCMYRCVSPVVTLCVCVCVYKTSPHLYAVPRLPTRLILEMGDMTLPPSPSLPSVEQGDNPSIAFLYMVCFRLPRVMGMIGSRCSSHLMHHQ